MRKIIRHPTILLLCCLLPCFLLLPRLAASSCDASLLSAAPEPLARRKGVEGHPSARLVGLFDVHEGDRCHLLRPGGMEHVLMAAAAVDRGLAAFEGNASDVGFEIYDTCSSTSVSLHHLMHALSPLACPQRSYVGVIGPKNAEIQAHLSGFLRTLAIPYVPLEATSLMEEVQAMCKVLSDLRWKVVSVIASNAPLLDEFRGVADLHNICIASSATTLPPGDRSDVFLRMKFQEATSAGVQVAVVLGSSIRLRALQDASLAANSSVRHWLLAGTDEDAEDDPAPFSPDHPVILFRKSADLPSSFDPGLEESYEFDDKIRRLNLVRSYAEFVSSCGRAGGATNDSGCADQFRHSSLQRRLVEESVERLFGIMLEAGVLKQLDSNETEGGSFPHPIGESGGVEIWTYQHARLTKPLAKHKEILVGHFADGTLNWDKKVLNVFRAMGSGWFKIPEFHCQPDCQERCENFDRISPDADTPEMSLFGRVYHRWRHEAWVSVLLTVSCVGALAALLAAAFLLLSSCREDSDEGSQASNLLLLTAAIFSYGCTLLFAFDRTAVTCRTRLAIVGLAHATLLAPPLSRVLVLIAAEMDGVHSHISGFLQASLCAALGATQVAMSTYFWLAPDAGVSPFRCTYEAGPTAGYLSYCALLSLCWLVASPFCVRSRRNHREGLLLHFCGVAVALTWLAWCLLFFLLHPRWNEFAVCLGVVAAPTSVLATLFAPKVYKVVVATAARRHGGGHATLQPVVFASTSSRSPNLSIYESVNHGFNPDKDGFVVDVFRDEEDSPRPRKMTHL